jgi:cellulose synthase/poly-beta-1,6-N-acetylglucosamine synthase-like glycosyltransferase
VKAALVAGVTSVATVQIVWAGLRGRAAKRLRRWEHAPAPATWPSASIIIPAWRERGTLEACLAQLRNIDYEDYEVIVVAGGPDGTLEAASEYALQDLHVSVMRQRENGGKNGAMNDGARRASKEVLVFMDADTVVARGWLKGLIAALGDRYAASTGKFLPIRRTLVSEAGVMSQVLENEARGRVILQGSGGVAVRRPAFESIGGIPEGRYADDWVLSARLREQGYRVAYAPAALQYTERPATLGEWWANELRWRRQHLLTLFGAAQVELRAPVSAAKALYPYAVAWSVVGLTVAALLARVARLHSRPVVEAAFVVTICTALARELAGPVETATYTGQASWLRTILVMPILTGLGWLASAVATVSTGRAGLHFKGPRQDNVKMPPELLTCGVGFPAGEAAGQVEVLP